MKKPYEKPELIQFEDLTVVTGTSSSGGLLNE